VHVLHATRRLDVETARVVRDALGVRKRKKVKKDERGNLNIKKGRKWKRVDQGGRPSKAPCPQS
jgi:hypothetical protein